MSADSRGKTKADREAGQLAPGAHLRAEIRRLGLDQVAAESDQDTTRGKSYHDFGTTKYTKHTKDESIGITFRVFGVFRGDAS